MKSHLQIPAQQGKVNPFIEGEGRVQDFSLVDSLPRKESFFFLLGSAMGVWELPLLVSWLCLIEISVYYFFIVGTIVSQPLWVLKIRVPEDRLRNCFKKVCVWFWCTLGICKTRMHVLTYGLGHSQETVTNTWIPDSSSLSWAYMLALPPCSGTESLPRGNESSLPLCTN